MHEEEAEEEGEKRGPFMSPPQVACWNMGYWRDEPEDNCEEGGWEYWPKTPLSSRPGVDYNNKTTTTTTSLCEKWCKYLWRREE